MNKPDLNNFTDKEILSMILGLRAGKFLAVINALGAVSQSMERRGKLLASESSSEEIDNMIRKLFEGEE